MFEKFGVGGSKEIVLILKNFGMCYMKKYNFEEVMVLLRKV